jgi:2-methylcitrate dehydratase PrpD
VTDDGRRHDDVGERRERRTAGDPVPTARWACAVRFGPRPSSAGPSTTLGAKFSIPHAVAATLILGTGGRPAFTREALNAADVATFREKVTLATFEPMLP